MKSELIKRLEAIENQLGADEDRPVIWISRPKENNEHPPAIGWTEAMCSDAITVMREPGESDESLQERTLAAFKAKSGNNPMAAAVFISIHSSA